MALALALRAEPNAFLPQPQRRKDAGAFGVACQGTAVQLQMMYFQTMISKILVKLTEGILDISPQKYYLDSPHPLPPLMGHILFFFFFSFSF